MILSTAQRLALQGDQRDREYLLDLSVRAGQQADAVFIRALLPYNVPDYRLNWVKDRLKGAQGG